MKALSLAFILFKRLLEFCMNTLRRWMLILCGLSCFGSLAWGGEGQGEFTPTLEREGQVLVRNGSGVRTRLVFDVYAIALYLPQRAETAEAALSSPPPRVIAIRLLRRLDGRTFAEALWEGLEKNHAPDALAPFRDPLARLRAAMEAAGEMKAGTAVEITENLHGETSILVDGQALMEPVREPGFFPVLLAIWLGPSPAQESLKGALVGR